MALALGLGACGSGKGEASAVCASERAVGTACAGLRGASVCDGDVCTTGASCSTVHRAANDAELGAATSTAQSGSCIVLMPGTYGEAVLPGGVSLLGKGADAVRIGKVVVGGGGTGALVRGMAISGSGIELPAPQLPAPQLPAPQLPAPQRVRIEGVRIQGTGGDAIAVGAGASVTIVQSEIDGAGRNAVFALDAASVEIEGVLIEHSRGPAVWVENTQSCQGSSLRMKDSLLRDNKVVGVSIVSSKGTLENVEVSRNGVASDFSPGAGVAASKCSAIDGKSVRVTDNTGYGVLVDGSSGSLVDIEVSRNLMGLWVQNLDASQPVTIERAKVIENQGVGVGLANATGSVTMRGTEIASTKTTVLPTFSKGAISTKEVGDGLAWTGKSTARIEGLTLRGNARASLLIDGSVGAGSRIESVTLAGGDESKGIVQQNFPSGGVSPELGPALPAPQRVDSEVFDVPQAPKVPARITR